VRQRIAFKICMLLRNCVNGSAPICLQEICNPVSADVHRPRLRTTDHGDLVVPRANTDRFGQRGFPVSGPNQCNKLPSDIRKVSDKPEQFARALKTFFISKQHRQALLRITSKEGYSKYFDQVTSSTLTSSTETKRTSDATKIIETQTAEVNDDWGLEGLTL